MSLNTSVPLFLARNSRSGYQIERSLRFNDDDTAYLSRTPSGSGTGAGSTWTWSGWVKRGTSTISNQQLILSASSSRSGFGFFTYSGGGTGSDTFSIYHNASFNQRVETTQVFRDFSSWYHVVVSVDTTQATPADRIRIYVNGDEVTDFSSATYPAQNYQFGICEATAHAIGRDALASAYYYDGYLAETYLIDGSALDHTSFGRTDTQTGTWIPKKYTGSYGTNGFYLNFSDNSSPAALGTDSSPNGNNWTQNNFSVTAGTGNDSVTDSPTNNYPTLNPLDKTGGTMDQGNLTYAGVYSDVVTRNGHGARSTLKVPSSGKWYVEAANITYSGSGNSCYLTFTSSEQLTSSTSGFAGTLTPHIGVDASVFNNNIRLRWVGVSGGTANGTELFSTYASGDIVNLAIDFDDGKFWVGKNGTWYNSGDPAAGTNATSTFTAGTIPWGFWAEYVASSDNSNRSQPRVNFGQQGFEYTAPSGFLEMNTANLPEPTIKDGSKYFDSKLWTATGTDPLPITGLEFSPDLVWAKARSDSYNHVLVDQIRGVNHVLSSNLDDAESTITTVTQFNSDGFNAGGTANNNYSLNCIVTAARTYVAWNWKAGGSSNTFNVDGTGYATASAAGITDGSIALTAASVNTTAGFSIVSYTSNGTSGATVGHHLNKTPSFIIVKMRSSQAVGSANWAVYHKSLGATKNVWLDVSNSENTSSAYWNNTEPTSSVFSLGNDLDTNHTNGYDYIAYCFAEVEGFSKFGSYVGNGLSDGPFVHCGFRPALVVIKRHDNIGNWEMMDNQRLGYNDDNDALRSDLTNTEVSRSFDILSNGFKIRQDSGLSNHNATGGTYLFMAFAETPFKYSTAR